MQNVKTPRLYINIPDYLASRGTTIPDVYRTLPVGENIFLDPIVNIPAGILGDKCFIALLGHQTSVYKITSDGGSTYHSLSNVINASVSGNNAVPDQDGFSISTFDATNETSLQPANISGNIGSVVMGIYYDFPFSPDVKLTISYDYGKENSLKTIHGSKISNTMFVKPPRWGTLGAWELGSAGSGSYRIAKSGRRVFDLSFTYLSDTDVFPDNAGLLNDNNTSTNTLLRQDTFQRIVHLTNGGQIPFILQIDKTQTGSTSTDGTSGYPRPDQFAIVTFDMDSFSYKLVANNLYSIRLRLKETW